MASALYLLSWSGFVRRDGEGATIVDSCIAGSIPQGSAVWSGPPHTLENVGESDLHPITVELKTAK
jgi:hypothetical protein